MKLFLRIVITVVFATVIFIGCSENKTEQTKEKSVNNGLLNLSKKGKNVPNNMVCMVNDAYMGKQQIEVPYESKMYYGCCDNCKEKIPKEANVRYATDPHSLKKISKADAYIVVIGNNDEVAYFESKENYQLFLEENSTL
ncbi:hypothetical protein [Empedobacter sedimenti]|uniref:hypothetical protein n=1 Tax=Empedobacter sedimenti TaxID=3042610 RepID=UPI0024A765A0|nr:hypothetical protein [Empedobacter sedimenti]